MELLNDLAMIYRSNLLINVLIVPLLLCALLSVLYRRRDEFSYHAIQNTAATLLVATMNFGVVLLFFNEINEFAQEVYAALHIPRLRADIWDEVPFALVVLIGIAAKDFADYWNHRLMHMKWFWPTHAAHHSDTHVNAFTTYRVHFLESLVMTLSYILLLTWLQMPATIPFVVMLAALHNHYVHMNLPWNHGPLRYLVASPAFHRWHHADVPEAYGKNLANIIPLWDKLFGTYYYPGPCEAEMGALKTGVEDKNPLLIYIYPVLEWARLIRNSMSKQRPLEAPPQDTQERRLHVDNLPVSVEHRFMHHF